VKIANFSIKRSVTITMIMIAVMVVGIFSASKLPQELYPKLDLPIAAVATTWSGASPQEVEQQVTSPLEQAMQSLSGVDIVQSTSTQGSSLVIVQFNFGVNISTEMDQMRDVISRTQGLLPSEVTAPVVEQFDPTQMPIMNLALSGSQSQQAISDVATNIVKPALEHLNGVASASESGNLTRQITVQVDPAKLAIYHLSIGQIVQALQSSNLTADAGQVKKGSLLIPLHINGQFQSPDELENVPVSVGKGQSVPLSSVADIVDGNKTVTLISTMNGKPAVNFSIVQSSSANTVEVSNEVNQTVKTLQKQLPQGIQLTVLSDDAQTIRDTIQTVISHTIIGFILGILIILLILRSIKTTAVVAVAIPIAVLATFGLMYLGGLTLNSITLGSLAVGLGSLVDFSIVVLESIFRARQTGQSAIEAAKQGTQEVGLAVVVAALAQISVFAPSIFVPGIAGQFFRPLALTVSFSHLAALFIALTFTPMLASRLLRGKRFEVEERIPGKNAPFHVWNLFDWIGRGMHELTSGYKRALNWSLNHRKTIVGGAFAMLIASFLLVPLIGFEFAPNVATNQMSITMNLADGTDLSHTTQTVEQVEALAKSHMKGIKTLHAVIGGTSTNFDTSSTNKASLDIAFNDNVSATDVGKMAHDFGNVVENIPGAKILVAAGSANSGATSSDISVQIHGPDMNTLTILSNQVTDIMRHTPGLQYVDNQLATGVPDYELNINQNALAQYGLTEQQVTSALNTAFQGAKASTFHQGNQQYDIVVKVPDSFSQNINNLSQVTIENSSGQFVPVTQIATLTTSEKPPEIAHVNDVRTVTVSATPYGVTSGRVQSALTSKFKSMHIPAGYSIDFGQNGDFLNKTFIDLGLAFGFSILLLYMVMASLFESILTPFVIMFCLPPTFIGAALGLFLTHRSVNIDSMIGIIMVMGLIANNAIVLIDYTNQLRDRGLPLREALLEAGPIRLRPILMSTLTTVLAMMPLVIGRGTGSETLAAMATVIAFGLTFSTLVTLVLVPVVYVMLDNRIQKLKQRFHRKQRAGTAPADSTVEV
jgi:hydrophobic/amphiphilic exporter-1 (mainly G- bacteria), HAE1 family